MKFLFHLLSLLSSELDDDDDEEDDDNDSELDDSDEDEELLELLPEFMLLLWLFIPLTLFIMLRPIIVMPLLRSESK